MSIKNRSDCMLGAIFIALLKNPRLLSFVKISRYRGGISIVNSFVFKLLSFIVIFSLKWMILTQPGMQRICWKMLILLSIYNIFIVCSIVCVSDWFLLFCICCFAYECARMRIGHARCIDHIGMRKQKLIWLYWCHSMLPKVDGHVCRPVLVL